MDKPELDKSAEAEAARLRWILDNPDAARHLLRLLEEGRSNKRDDFRIMVDRLMSCKPMAHLE